MYRREDESARYGLGYVLWNEACTHWGRKKRGSSVLTFLSCPGIFFEVHLI